MAVSWENMTASFEMTTEGNGQTGPDSSQGSTRSTIFTGKVMGTLYITIGILGILGNGLVILVMGSSKKLRNKLINMYIINQSCIDCVVSVILVAISGLTSHVPYAGVAGDVYCLFWASRVFLWGFLLSSTYNLMALTLERYAELVHPIWHRNHFSQNITYISIGAIWIMGPVVQGCASWSTSYVKDSTCFFYSRWASARARQFYAIMVVIIKMFLPLIILLYSYGHIAFVLQRKIQTQSLTLSKDNQLTQNTKDERLAKGRRNTIKTLFIVACCFTVCWVWNQGYYFMMNVGYPPDYSSNFYHLTVLAVYVNSIINPFIYCLKYEQFQRVVRQAVCGRCGWGNKVGDVATTMTASDTRTTSTTQNNTA